MSWSGGLDKKIYSLFSRHRIDWLSFEGRVHTIGDVDYRVFLRDNNGHILLATGNSDPGSVAGFAKGALYIKSNASNGVRALYENIGTTTVSNFNLIGDFIASDITLAQGKILVGNASGIAEAVSVSGDATLASDGKLTLADSVIADANVKADAGIGFSKLEALDSGKILVGDDSNVATPVDISGDASLANDGTLSISAVPKFAVRSVTGSTSVNTAGNTTITAEMMLKGVVLRDCNGDDRSDMLDSVANIVSAITSAGRVPEVGMVVEFYVYNDSMPGQSWTYTLGSGMNPVPVGGSHTIGFTQWIKFILMLTDVESGTEAADLYVLPNNMIMGGMIDSLPVNKLATLTAGQIIVGDSSDVATAVSVSGDITLASDGEVAIAAGVIVDADVNASAAINGSKIVPRFNQLVHEKTSVSTESTAGNAQYDPSDVLTGFLDRNCNGGSRSDVLPDADDLVAAITSPYVGQTWDCLISNVSSGGYSITLTGGIDCVLRPTPITISQNKSALIRFVLTNVGSGTEAYSAYLVSLTT